MTAIVITGHASLDHVALLDGAPQAGRTTTILDRPAGAWPRLGGSPAYVAAALVGAGVARACPVSWIGDDADGREYLRQLESKGIPADGVAVVKGARTPIALLAYEPAGGCVCLYDPGMRQDLEPTPRQRELLAAADWICLTIGPPSITDAVLAAAGEDKKLAWVMKHDPRSLSRDQAARLARRADLICFSQAEAALLGEVTGNAAPRLGQIRIGTQGRAGAALTVGGVSETVAAAPLAVTDPTGAGDSFAGGVLAALAKGESGARAIVESGHEAARRLLLGRQTSDYGSA